MISVTPPNIDLKKHNKTTIYKTELRVFNKSAAESNPIFNNRQKTMPIKILVFTGHCV